jgi:hypothetical protein
MRGGLKVKDMVNISDLERIGYGRMAHPMVMESKIGRYGVMGGER